MGEIIPIETAQRTEMTGGHGTIRGLTFEYTWIGLALGAGHSGERGVTDGGYLVEGNLIERNRIMGGVGVGIALNHASRNRILDSTITGIKLRDPSLGEANGAGLWVSPGSDENEMAGNILEDIATHAIVLEGGRRTVSRASRR